MRTAYLMASNGPEQFGTIARLSYALNDADRLAACLGSARCKFDVVMTQPGAKPSEVIYALETLCENCKPDDIFVCYFSGHGVLDNQGKLFLLWDNSQPDKTMTSALSATKIMEALYGCPARNRLLLLDCCHAGAVSHMVGFKGASEVSLSQAVIPPDNYVVLMASGRSEKAHELAEVKGSFFTHSICAALQDEFARADSDQDGRLSIKDLSNWLDECAIAYNRRHPDNTVPYPSEIGKYRGDFYLTLGREEWVPIELPWPDGSTMVMLPVRDRAYPEWAVFIGKYPVTNAQFRRYVALGERIEPRWGMARAVWWNTEPGRRLRAQDMHRIRTWRHQEGRPVGELFTHNVNKADGHWEGPFEPWNDPHFSADDQPVVCIDFFLAYRYARWVSQMAHDERIVTTLPSVRAWDIGCFGNIFPSRDPRNWLETSAGIHHRKEAPATIDRSGGRTNRWGISDLIGNVWEWCSDEIAAQSMSHLAILSAPYPASPAALRGGGYLDDMEKVSPFLDVASLRDQEYTSHTDLGFRIAAAVHVSRVPTDVGQRLATVDMADELIFFHPTK